MQLSREALATGWGFVLVDHVLVDHVKKARTAFTSEMINIRIHGLVSTTYPRGRFGRPEIYSRRLEIEFASLNRAFG